MEKRIKRIYIDTSVIYGAPSKEFSQDSKMFWNTVRQDNITIIASDILDGEIDRAPTYVGVLFAALPKSQIERHVSTADSNDLAARYISEGVVGKKSLEDCRHIAIATIAQADAIVSWNFTHMVDRQNEYNRVNEKLGYTRIEIINPKQFMETYNEKH